MPMTPAEMTKRYLQLRAMIKQIEDKHKNELAPYLDVKFQLETALLDHLNRNGLDSTKCPDGTAFKSTVTSVTVRDWPVTLDYIRDHELWDLLEARVSKSAAVEIVTDTSRPIPGVEITQATVLRVRTS
jgi:hypothetical protein